MGRVGAAAAIGGLTVVVLLVLGSSGLAASTSVAKPGRTQVGLRTPAQGKIAVAVVRFHRRPGTGVPSLQLGRNSRATSTAAVVVGLAPLPRHAGEYLGVVSVVNFRTGAAQSVRRLVSANAGRSFTVVYVGDAETYRGELRQALRRLSASKWRGVAAKLPPTAAEPAYRKARGLLDQVRRVVIGAPDPKFLATVRGTKPQSTSPPPSSPPPPPSPPPPTPPSPPPLVQLSSDPFTNPSSQHRAQVEPDSFAFGSTIVTAFQSGRFYNGGSSDIGFATSTDNGATWTNGFLPALTTYVGGSYDRASDPSVAYDARHGVWLITALTLHELPTEAPGVGVTVSKSTDGGLTWSAPVTIGTGTNVDKEWIVCDNHTLSPHYGSCYVEWDEIADSWRIRMSTSLDGGAHWNVPLKTVGNATGFSGQPLVQPNGRVIVPIVSRDSDALLVYDSFDGGQSWSNTTEITPITDHEAAGGLRTEPLPSAEIDADGTIYVVWQDCRFRTMCSSNDLVVTTTTQAGYPAWSPVTRIPIDPASSSVDHFIPGLGVDPSTSGGSAKLALAYYYYPDAGCTVSTCQLDVGLISSGDGGSTWGAPEGIAGPMNLGWLPSTTAGVMVGDYISTSFSAGVAHPFFALARPRVSAMFDEAIYTR